VCFYVTKVHILSRCLVTSADIQIEHQFIFMMTIISHMKFNNEHLTHIIHVIL